MAKQKAETKTEGTTGLKLAQRRTKGDFKQRGIAALPNGTPEEQMEAAIRIARDQGFLLEVTAEDFTPKKTRKRRLFDNDEPTFMDAIKVQQAAQEVEGGIEALADRLQEVVDLAMRVGGLAKLKKCLDLLTGKIKIEEKSNGEQPD